jgi:hypothetical protein
MSDRKIAWFLGVGAFLVLAPGALFGLPDGEFVVGATRVLAGEVPYRDFWTKCAPGSFYLVAAVFSVLGRELAFQALAACALWAACTVAFFRLLRDAGVGRRVAVPCALLLALARWRTGVELSSFEPAFLFVLLAWRRFLLGSPIRTGLLLGAAAVFQHDVAGCAAIGAVVATILERGSPLRLVLGFAAIGVPAALVVAWKCGEAVWQDLVLFPSADFLRALVRAHGLHAALAEVLLLGALAAGWQLRGKSSRAAWLGLASTPILWIAAHVRQDTHLLSMAAPAAVLLALAWETRALPRRALGLAGSICALDLLLPSVLGMAAMARAIPRAEILGIPGTALLLVPESTFVSTRPLVAFVRANVPEDQPIYIGLERHDATVISKPILYFLCGRPPAVPWHELYPGVTDREDVQADMLGWIAGRNVVCIVLWKPAGSNERLDAMRSPGSEVLDEWIAQGFRQVAAYGEYRVWMRRD